MNFTYNQKKIAALIATLKIENPGKELAIALAEKERVVYVYNTAALEGNPMTYPEVQTLLEGITVGGHKVSDEQQVLNQNDSWSLLLKLVKENKFKLDENTACALQAEVAKEEAIEWGKFRTSEVNIGGTSHKPPKSTELQTIFDSGIAAIEKINHPLEKALVTFLFGAINQFFFDGNKRTSRLMMNGVLLASGHKILNIAAKDRLEFNKKMIEFYDTQNADGILEYLIGKYISD
jgi:Fic family protein